MARIKIEDLPVLEDLSAKESKGIFGGALTTTTNTAAISGRWAQFAENISTGAPPRDINTLIQEELQDQYEEANADLEFHVTKGTTTEPITK